jgi:hypothetical protein
MSVGVGALSRLHLGFPLGHCIVITKKFPPDFSNTIVLYLLQHSNVK